MRVLFELFYLILLSVTVPMTLIKSIKLTLYSEAFLSGFSLMLLFERLHFVERILSDSIRSCFNCSTVNFMKL